MRDYLGRVICNKDNLYCGNWQMYSALCPYYSCGLCIEPLSNQDKRLASEQSVYDADYKDLGVVLPII